MKYITINFQVPASVQQPACGLFSNDQNTIRATEESIAQTFGKEFITAKGQLYSSGGFADCRHMTWGDCYVTKAWSGSEYDYLAQKIEFSQDRNVIYHTEYPGVGMIHGTTTVEKWYEVANTPGCPLTEIPVQK